MKKLWSEMLRAVYLFPTSEAPVLSFWLSRRVIMSHVMTLYALTHERR